MKKVWIWAITMGLISAIFGVRLGLIPGLILSWIISSIVDKKEEKKQEEKQLKDRILCPRCNHLNDSKAEHCANCGAPLIENSVINNTTNVAKIEVNNRDEINNKDETNKTDVINKKNEVSKTDKINNMAKTKIDNKPTDEIIKENHDNSKKIRFCRYCGAKIKSNAQFCQNCGKEI